MKPILLILILLVQSFKINAQRSKDEQLEDSIFAWKPAPALKPSAYPRTFSAAQLKYPGLFAQWLQKSYIPIGALDFSYAVAEPNKKDEVAPYATGLCAAMWRANWDDAGAKVIRQPYSENRLYIVTNTILDAEPIPMLTLPGQAVFTRLSPDINRAFAGNSQYKNQKVKQLNLENHPQIGKYLIQYYGCVGDGCMPQVAVYLTPNGKLPIRQLTKGEVLDRIEQAIPAERRGIESLMPNEKQVAVERVRTHIETLRKKYSNSLNTAANLRNSDLDMTDIFNRDDIFDTDDANKFKNYTYGIYTYEDGVMEKSKQDQPLWICISWEPTDINAQPYNIEKHRSMITHFNFDYVYNYFFKPELVKNKPYTILNEQEQKVHLASYKKKKEYQPTVTKKQATNIYFFEDFAGSSIGQKPQGWYMPASGIPAVVQTPAGETGHWVKLGQYKIMPNNTGKPLPENFKMEFDVCTDKDFTENTGGAFLLRIHNKILRPKGDYTDAPKQIFIDLDAKAGNTKFTQNPTGHTRIKATYTGMSSAIRHADVLQYSSNFSNKKNKVHFIITKQGTKVRGYVDGEEIIALDKNKKAIPAFNELPEGTRFTSFYFENISDKKQVAVYVSNIKIEKL